MFCAVMLHNNSMLDGVFVISCGYLFVVSVFLQVLKIGLNNSQSKHIF